MSEVFTNKVKQHENVWQELEDLHSKYSFPERKTKVSIGYRGNGHIWQVEETNTLGVTVRRGGGKTLEEAFEDLADVTWINNTGSKN